MFPPIMGGMDAGPVAFFQAFTSLVGRCELLGFASGISGGEIRRSQAEQENAYANAGSENYGPLGGMGGSERKIHGAGNGTPRARQMHGEVVWRGWGC